MSEMKCDKAKPQLISTEIKFDQCNYGDVFRTESYFDVDSVGSANSKLLKQDTEKFVANLWTEFSARNR